jgi:hypothetical protein
MNAPEIAFLIVLIAFLAGVYLTFRVINKCDDEEADDIWS